MPAAALSPIENYRSVLTTKYADFDGRARRAEYWWFTLVNFGVIIGALVVTVILRAIAAPLGAIAALAYVAVWLGTLVPGIAAAIRRLHDTGKSGWFMLIALIPFFGSIILLVFLFTDGSRESNAYGPSPKYG